MPTYVSRSSSFGAFAAGANGDIQQVVTSGIHNSYTISSVTSVSIQGGVAWAATGIVTDAVGLSVAIIADDATVLAAADASGTPQSGLVIPVNGVTSGTTNPITFTYVNSSATKQHWITANIQLTQSYSASMGSDQGYISSVGVFDTEVTVTNTTTRDIFLCTGGFGFYNEFGTRYAGQYTYLTGRGYYFGSVEPTDLSYLCYFANAVTRYADLWDISFATNTSYMFYGCDTFNQPVPYDTSNVIDMSYMFYGCNIFNQPITFDLSNATTLTHMFYDCFVLNQPITFTNTSNVTDLSTMFYRCYALNQPVTFDDTSSVTNMGAMFRNCLAFNQPVAFDTSSVTTMGAMFTSCDAFDQPLAFDVSKVTAMNSMFAGCDVFNQDISDWDTSSVTDMNYMFSNTYAFVQDLSPWPVPLIPTQPTNFSLNSAMTAEPVWGTYGSWAALSGDVNGIGGYLVAGTVLMPTDFTSSYYSHVDFPQIFLSGGTSNTDTNQSLGGTVSSTMMKALDATYTTTSIAGIELVSAVSENLGAGTLKVTKGDNLTIQWLAPVTGEVTGSFRVEQDGLVAIYCNENNHIVLNVTAASVPAGSSEASVTLANGNQNLWDNAAPSEGKLGSTSYRCVFVKNPSLVSHDYYFSHKIVTNDAGATYAMGFDPAEINSVQTIADEFTAPAGISFTDCSGVDFTDPPLTFTLAAGQAQAIWLRRTIPALGEGGSALTEQGEVIVTVL